MEKVPKPFLILAIFLIVFHGTTTKAEGTRIFPAKEDVNNDLYNLQQSFGGQGGYSGGGGGGHAGDVAPGARGGVAGKYGGDRAAYGGDGGGESDAKFLLHGIFGFPGAGIFGFPGAGIFGFPGAGIFGFPGAGIFGFPGAGIPGFPGAGIPGIPGLGLPIPGFQYPFPGNNGGGIFGNPLLFNGPGGMGTPLLNYEVEGKGKKRSTSP